MTHQPQQHLITLTLIVCGAFVFYVATMPATITLVDAGVFQMVCHAGGVAHPPGFPIATTLCHGFSQLPFAGVTAANLFSVTFAALTTGLLFAYCLRLGLSTTAATTAALMLATSGVFWENAIVVEVYALTAFFMLCLMHVALNVAQATSDSDTRRQLMGLSLLTGLSLANHWPLVVLSAPAVIATLNWHNLRHLLHAPTFMGCLVAMLLGLSPYLVLLTNGGSMLFHGPIESLAHWFRYIARQSYDSTFITQAAYAGNYLWWLPMQSLLVFGLPALLIPLGLYLSRQHLPPNSYAALLLLWFGSCILLPVLGNLTDSYFWRHIIVNWTFLAHISCAVWLGIAVNHIGLVVQHKLPGRAWLPAVLAGALVFATTGATLTGRYQPADRVADHYARTVLMLMPENATLLLQGDNQTGPIGYLHYVEGVRPDLTIRNTDNILFDNRLMSPFSPTDLQQQGIRQLISDSDQPVLSITRLDLPATDHGLFFQYNQQEGFRRSHAVDQFFDYLLDLRESGLVKRPSTRDLMETLLYDYARLVIAEGIVGSQHEAAFRQRLARVNQTLQGKIWTLHHLAATSEPRLKPSLTSMVAAGLGQINEATPDHAIAKLHVHAAEVAAMRPADLALAGAHLDIAATYTIDPCEEIRAEAVRQLRCGSDNQGKNSRKH